jgi:hypothetical protein
MSGLFGGGTISNEAEKLATIRIQTSAYGRVIPVVYGTARIAGNLLWYGDFVQTANTTQQKSGGVFGIGAVKTQNTTYQYNAAIALGLCEGPITGLTTVWSEKAYELFSASHEARLPALPGPRRSGLVVAHLESSDAGGPLRRHRVRRESVLAARRQRVAPEPELGGGRPLPDRRHRVRRVPIDANPGTIIRDLLTNVRYGLAWDAARIDVADFVTYCTAAGIFVSPAYTEQKPAA